MEAESPDTKLCVSVEGQTVDSPLHKAIDRVRRQGCVSLLV
jgi:hypothetical protein